MKYSRPYIFSRGDIIENKHQRSYQILIITFHLAQILELQHLYISTMIQLHHTLLTVYGKQLSCHVLVLISEDDLDLVPPTGDHGSQMVRGDVDGPLLLPC